MENRAHALIAGIFTLLLGAGVIVAAQWFSRDNYETVNYVLVSRYSVAGLNSQAPVRLRGVEVGKVDSIDFDDNDPRNILIRIAIKGGTRITQGTTAQLGTQGITGLAYIALEDDGSKPKFLPPSDDTRIVMQRSFMDELSTSGKDLIGQFSLVAQRVNGLLSDPNQQQLLRTLGSLDTLAQRLGVLAKDLEPAARSVPALAADARKTLQDTSATLASIDALSRELTKRADTLERVAKSAEQIGGATQGVANSATTDITPRLNGLLDELSRNSRNLDRLLTDLNEQPSGLVFGRTPGRPGPGESGFVGPVKGK